MWTNLVRLGTLKVECTGTFTPSYSSQYPRHENNEPFVSQLQVTVAQYEPEDNGKIFTLPCPSEVSNFTENPLTYMVITLDTLYLQMMILCSIFLLLICLPPLGTTLPEDRRKLSVISPQQQLSSPGACEFCLQPTRTSFGPALHASCQFLIVLCVTAQFTGTDMPCEDLSPSPSTPTSGKMTLKAFLEHLGDLKLAKK